MSAETKSARYLRAVAMYGTPIPPRMRLHEGRKRFKVARRVYLASKPRCACGRVGVEAVYFMLRDAADQEGWLCRGHRLPERETPDFEPCMCDWRRCCGGTGVLDCRGCGGDLCICTCGGETECDGCEDCNEDDDSLDGAYSDEDHDWEGGA